MGKKRVPGERKSAKKLRQETEEALENPASEMDARSSDLTDLQQRFGNRAVQRLLAQRSGDGSFELDDDTATRINQARSGGHPLDSGIQREMEAKTGHSFKEVRAHTSKEADALSQQLRAKAFTTGKDVFFREGAYDPHSSSGRELIAHELTHVVQQSTGKVTGGGRMRVTDPGGAHEQEADALAQAVLSTDREHEIQRQTEPEEEEEEVEMQEEEEDEAVEMQEEEEEEEEEEGVHLQPVGEEEEIQTSIMRQKEGKTAGIGMPGPLRVSASDVGKSLSSLVTGVSWAQDAILKIAKKLGMT